MRVIGGCAPVVPAQAGTSHPCPPVRVWGGSRTARRYRIPTALMPIEARVRTLTATKLNLNKRGSRMEPVPAAKGLDANPDTSAAAPRMTAVDLFCGIGGFHIAATQNGISVKFASEIHRATAHCYETNLGLAPHGRHRPMQGQRTPTRHSDGGVPLPILQHHRQRRRVPGRPRKPRIQGSRNSRSPKTRRNSDGERQTVHPAQPRRDDAACNPDIRGSGLHRHAPCAERTELRNPAKERTRVRSSLEKGGRANGMARPARATS